MAVVYASLAIEPSLADAQATADGGATARIGMPPPPPQDPTPSAALDAASQASVVTATSETSPNTSASVVSETPSAPPPPPGAAIGDTRSSVARERASIARRRARAARTLTRVEAIVHDQAEADRAHRRAIGTALLVGGSITAAAGVVPFFVAPTPYYSSVFVGSTALALGGVVTLTGALMYANRGFWEEIDDELRADVVPEPEHRLSALVQRWNARVARERGAQRTTAIVFMALGAASLGLGVASFVDPSLAGGVGYALSAPFFALGATYLPLGIATLNLRTPSERALRMLRLSQGGALEARVDRGTLTVAVAPAGHGLALIGLF